MLGVAHAEDASDDCARVLAQVKILKENARVYRQGPGGACSYLPEKERPTEAARLNNLAMTSCSAEDAARRRQQEDANTLVIALGVRCAEYRDELAMLQRPSARASKQDIDRRQAFVAKHCPEVSRDNIWLPDRVTAVGPGIWPK